MRLIALVSGGKDSVLSMMMAQAHGHEIAFIANLFPTASPGQAQPEQGSEDAEEDLDSYCFQTVGHGAIEHLAAALDIPLRRRGIAKGQSVQTGMVYDTTGAASATDEVEEMFALVKSIVDEAKAAGAPVGGVCSGAILSDYQRLRVEHVCTRLGLLSYSYLWQKPAEYVLDLVGRLRVEAILIKVASMGLVPKKHLGRTLVALQPHLESLAPHVHPAGEGGEFETFVLGCPLITDAARRLAVTSSRVVVVDDNPIAPTGHMRFEVAPRGASDAAVSVGAEEAVRSAIASGILQKATALRLPLSRLGLPHMGDDEDEDATPPTVESMVKILEAASAERFPRFDAWRAANPELIDAPIATVAPGEADVGGPATRVEGAFGAEALYSCRGPDATASAGDQVRAVFASLSEADRKRVFYTMVFLPTLDAFAEVNKAYTEFFGVSPPSRAVVENSGVAAVTIDVYLAPPAETREVLHVQSVSAWAAACIGPYAQANRLPTPNLLVTAGVIGLEPGAMAYPGSPGSSTPVLPAGAPPLTTEDRLLCEFKVCVENLSATLVRLGTSLQQLTHAQVFVTSAAHATLAPALFRWATGGEATLPVNVRAVVLSKLPRGGLVEIFAAVQGAPKGDGEDDEEGATVAAAAQQQQQQQVIDLFWRRPGLFAPCP